MVLFGTDGDRGDGGGEAGTDEGELGKGPALGREVGSYQAWAECACFVFC